MTAGAQPGESLQKKLASLESAQRATLNILEDFNCEKQRLEEVQRATVNILEDFEAEKSRFEGVQRATLNILEDFDHEKARLQQVQRATLNVLEDFDGEKARLEGVQRATLNILEDFDEEKAKLQLVQRAALNILEDFDAEKGRLDETQRALLNILEDIDAEKAKVAGINQQLEATNQELEAFCYSVSHDLRAPLRGIDGFSQALLEDYTDKLDGRGKDHLRRVRAAAQRMGTLIEDLLNLSRVTRAKMLRENVDLSHVAIAVAEELRKSQPKREVEFLIAPDAEARGDSRLLRIVIENLLNNAWKYTSKNSRAHIEFGMAQHNGRTAYFVRDNGAGFDPAYAERLFGAFQRLHSVSEFPGTGVGLATVQRIIRRHGGEVWAEGAVGEGASFYFTLGAQ